MMRIQVLLLFQELFANYIIVKSMDKHWKEKGNIDTWDFRVIQVEKRLICGS